MTSKITLGMMDEEKDEEWQPLNAMVTENLKNIIIRKIYKDVEKNVTAQKKGPSPVVRQYFAALGPITAALSSGMSAGYSAILLPQLMAADSEIVITKDEGSWIASMLALPLIFGCLVSGYVMDNLGRRTSQILSCIPFTIGWVVLALSPNVPALYVGRFITGFCMGLISPMCQVYIAETSQPEHRGILLSGAPLNVAIGIFISHILGTFFTWKITAGLCGIPPLVCIILLAFAPESPLWLLQKGRIESAQHSFRWFRGDSEEATKEFNNLLNKNKTSEESSQTSKLKLFFKGSFMKPFLVLNMFFLVQQFSGVNAVAFYSVHILKDVMTSMNEYISTILIDVVRFVISAVAVLLLKKYGRKSLSVVSAVGTAVSLFLLAIYLGVMTAQNGKTIVEAVNETNFENNTSYINTTNLTTIMEGIQNEQLPGSLLQQVLSYLPLLFLISYICFVSIGLVPIPWVLTGELFSKEMRGIGSGGTSSFGFLCYFAVVKMTPDLFEGLGNYGAFCFFGVISIIGSVVLALYLPETKDKTLLEIEAFYKKKNSTDTPVEQNGRSSVQN